MKFISRQHQRFGNAIRGFYIAYDGDKNFKHQIWSSLFFCAFGLFMSPLSDAEFLFLVLSYILILITELQNTAFETALDHLHPERHEEIGASKDIAATAVMLAGVFAGVVFVTILVSRM